jgi:tetratricopeptide (TPR) repeat protein
MNQSEMTDSPTPSPLHKAAALIRVQQFQEALDILIPYITENPNSDGGWFLLSFAIQDRNKKQECLERAIKINPNHTRAQERLAKLQASTRRGGAIPHPPQTETSKWKTRRRWAILPVVVLLVALISYIIVIEILPSFSPDQNQAVADQPQIHPTDTPTQSLTSTGSPSQTPAATVTDSPTPTLSPTIIPPTPTKDFPYPEGQLAQEMDDIQNQVSTIRELSILVDSPRYIIPQAKVGGLLRAMFMERNTRDEVNDQARVLNVLGLIEPTYDLYSNLINNLDEGLGGLYIPWTDELFVIGEEFAAVEKFVYAHEYEHALIDQHYHLEDIGVYPECIRETDRCSAISGLVEGDATNIMYQWLEAYASEDDIAIIDAAEFTPIDQVITSSDYPPPYAIRDVYFKYFDGQNFVEYLLEMGGWESIDTAFQDLPISTEQILHPEKYLTGESPIQVDLRPLDGILGDDWRHLATGTLGELTTEMVLGYSANYLVQIDPITAAAAAAGWGGDTYQVFYRSRSNQTILIANWEWDTFEDRNEFWEAMSEYLNRRYFGDAVTETDYDCWTKLNDHYSCIYNRKNNTLWVIAPTWEIITQILDQYPGFK